MNKAQRGKFLSPSLERKILRSFGRASTKSPWWEEKRAQLKHCLQCAGTLVWRYVEQEKRERFVCGQCASILYENPKVVAATLPTRNDKIYLLRRDIEPSRGLWTYPAGFMEMGESVEQAAARETWEEIRCRVKILGLQNIYSYPDAAVVTVVYQAQVAGREPSPGHETQCVKAFHPWEIPWQELAFRSTFDALRDWTKGIERDE
jgi:ADP-ribose pyrophosphatase YjhB (NUDIX family)